MPHPAINQSVVFPVEFPQFLIPTLEIPPKFIVQPIVAHLVWNKNADVSRLFLE